MAYSHRGMVIVANATRDFAHVNSHTNVFDTKVNEIPMDEPTVYVQMTQKQAETRDTSGCLLRVSDRGSASMFDNVFRATQGRQYRPKAVWGGKWAEGGGQGRGSGEKRLADLGALLHGVQARAPKRHLSAPNRDR